MTNDHPQPASNTPVLLRPHVDPLDMDSEEVKDSKSIREDEDTYRLVHLTKQAEMWNKSFQDHTKNHSSCRGILIWDTHREQQRGFAWRAGLKCDACDYLSPMYNLFKEIPSSGKGRKAAAINYGIQVGLSQISVGSTGLRKLLLSGNIPAPSTKGLQDSANKVCKKIEEANKKDMFHLRQELKTINKLGHPINQIDVESDGCYNNPSYSGVNKTPFQPATQSCYVVVENLTNSKVVVNVITKNQLCSYGIDHSVEDLERKLCKCTQNLHRTENIENEERSAKEGFQTLYSEGFEIRHVTTDPDTSAYKAAEDLSVEYKSQTKPTHFIDTRHFSENHRKFIKRNDQMQNLMPASTKLMREKYLNKFATDLSERCQAEYESALNKCGSNAAFKRSLSHVVDAIVLCYQNKHVHCKKNSYVCNSTKMNWLKNSKVLPEGFKLKLTIQSQVELRKCVNYRLGPKELDRTKLGTNSQKSECVNKVIRRSLPRNINFIRNFPGRANSAVYSSNHGPGESVTALCLTVGSPIAKYSKVARSLKSEQKKYNYNKEYKKTRKYKSKRRKSIKASFKLHAKHQEEQKYQKGKLLSSKNKSTASVRASKGDHDGYTKKRKRIT